MHDAATLRLNVRIPVAAMLMQIRSHLRNEYFVIRRFIPQNYEKLLTITFA